MISNYDKDKYKHHAADFLQSHFHVDPAKNFRCINPTHYDKDPSMGYHKESHTARCFSNCGARYDIYELVGMAYNLNTFTEKYNKVEEIYGGGSRRKDYAAPKIRRVDFTDRINKFHAAVGKTDYFTKRGLSDDIIKKYKLGYNEGDEQYPYIIPVTKSFYFGRCIYPDEKMKTKNPSGSTVEILNKHHLFREGIVFVVEGWADALSIEQLGFKAISLNGAGNHNKVIRHKEDIVAKLVIIGDDNEAGHELNEKLSAGLVTEYCINTLPNKYDANDMLRKDPDGLRAFLAKERTFAKNKPKHFVDIDTLTEDTLISEEVAKYYSSIKDHIEKSKVKAQLLKKAKDLKMTTAFNSFIKPYDREPTEVQDTMLSVPMPLNLKSGDWTISDSGVTRRTGKTTEKACSHPICITKILRNQDTGNVKKELAYFVRNSWNTHIVDRSDIAEPKSITQLINKGIAVTCINAKNLIEFLADIETLNLEVIPFRYSVSKLGWTSKKDFSPYCDCEFDGEHGCKVIFEAMKPAGNYEQSLEVVNRIRSNDVARLLVAASLVSPLLSILKLPTFFVHVWGRSGIGKSNALRIVTSMWGNYEVMMRSMNSTTVAFEKLAGFYNNVPLPLDELQSMKDKDTLQSLIYMLSNGTSRSRSNRQGGIDAQDFWCNTILTTGEEPLTNDFSNAGAKNRTIEITMESPLFEEKLYGEVMPKALENYGHIGKEFTDILKKTKVEVLQTEYKLISKKCVELGLKGKQLICAASIALGDYMFETRLMGQSQEQVLQQAGELLERNKQFFPGDDELQIGNRAYAFLLNWIVANESKFSGAATYAERYGVIDERKEYAYIVQTKMRDALKDAGFNYMATLRELAYVGLLIKNDKRNEHSIPYRLNGITTACYKLMLTEPPQPKSEPHQTTFDEMIPIEDGNLPF